MVGKIHLSYAGNRCSCTVTFVVGVVSCGVGVSYGVY